METQKIFIKEMQTELLERRLICVMKNTLDGTNGMLDMAEKFEDIKMKHI